LSELQKLEQIHQPRRWLVLRDLAKSRSFPYVLIIAWQWL